MAIRKFKLMGLVTSKVASARITIDGKEVFNGELMVSFDPDLPIASGEVDLDDSIEISVPVMIEATGGEFAVGMLSWNYASIVNPLLSAEELEYLEVSSEQTPADVQAGIVNKGGRYIRLESEFNFGDDPEEARDNRSNIRVNGVPENVLLGFHIGILLGDVLTFDSKVFMRGV